MPSVSTLIGERFEDILANLYPEITRTGDITGGVPDFEHPDFFAEAKACYCQHDYSVSLKERQVEGFLELEKKKPIVYLIGMHNFAGAQKRLGKLSDSKRRNKLLEMDALRFYVVDNVTVSNIFRQRYTINEKKTIHYCNIKEVHLRQIIEDRQIEVGGLEYSARSYYGVSSRGFSFGNPVENQRTGVPVGHIIPKKMRSILDYFSS